MWCPKCKNEYRAGFTHCPDCDVDLVESLEEVLTPVIFGEKEPIEQMVAFLISNGIAEAACRKDEEDDTFELVVPAREEKQTKELINAFLMQKAMEEERAENGFEDEDDPEAEDGEGTGEDGDAEDEDGEDEAAGEALVYAGSGDEQEEDIRPGTYKSKRTKAEEYKASAFALFLVGILGAVAVALLYLDKLPFHLYGSSKVLICVVMEVMFVAFVIGGYIMMKSYKTLLEVADAEEASIEKIKRFLTETVTAEYVDQKAAEHLPDGRSLSELSDEQVYFPRMEAIKQAIREHTPDIDKLLLEKLSDDWYTGLYGEE